MARLKIENVTKKFGEFKALDNVSLDVADGEFLAVVGPSGCGKTTLLRLIAGFEHLNGGTITIGDRVVSTAKHQIPTEDRHVGIVFQSYALWPHMSVAENVAYGLKVAKIDRRSREARVSQALALVGLESFGDRKPSELSGGQRQRVALARCLVLEPALVLLDEPLANLDVHLRASMEDEFADFHERTKTTMVYITHDQAEAMALADRIAVLNLGRLEQLAMPSSLYAEPATEMVASFIGQGMVAPVELRAKGNNGTCHARLFGLDLVLRCRPDEKLRPNASACLRTRDLSFAKTGEAGIPAIVRRKIYQPGFFRVEVHPEAAPDLKLMLREEEPANVAVGEQVRISVHDGWVIPGPATENPR